MSGVLFTVTIPTEQEEQNLEQNEKTPAVSLKSEKEKQESDIYENGSFKIVRFLFIIIMLSNCHRYF